jgi:chromosome segregation ATPase
LICASGLCMTDFDLEVELAVAQEKLKNIDDDLKSLKPEIDKNTDIINNISDKLIARIEVLERENDVQKKEIADLQEYKRTSDDRIDKLEDVRTYYNGIISAICFLLGSGIIAILLKSYVFTSK